MKFRIALALTLITASAVAPQLAAADDAPAAAPSAKCLHPSPQLHGKMTALQARVAAATQAGKALDLTPPAFEALALDIERELAAIQADSGLMKTTSVPVKLLLSDIRDGTVLMRQATHTDARRIGLVKVMQDLEAYRRAAARTDCEPPPVQQ
ncbi:MAG: hypothetical protein J0M28_03160 [Thauera sp.]|nr:hypothetical protein [Thauera sp.]